MHGGNGHRWTALLELRRKHIEIASDADRLTRWFRSGPTDNPSRRERHQPRHGKSGSHETRRWWEVDSNPRSRRGLPTCYAVSPIIRPPDCTSCCPGIGRYAKSPPLPLDNLPSRPWDAYQWYRALSRSGGSRPVHCVGCSNHIQSANGSNFPWMKGGGRSPDVHQAKGLRSVPFSSARRHLGWRPEWQSVGGSPHAGGKCERKTPAARKGQLDKIGRPPSRRLRRPDCEYAFAVFLQCRTPVGRADRLAREVAGSRMDGLP